MLPALGFGQRPCTNGISIDGLSRSLGFLTPARLLPLALNGSGGILSCQYCVGGIYLSFLLASNSFAVVSVISNPHSSTVINHVKSERLVCVQAARGMRVAVAPPGEAVAEFDQACKLDGGVCLGGGAQGHDCVVEAVGLGMSTTIEASASSRI